MKLPLNESQCYPILPVKDLWMGTLIKNMKVDW